MNSGTFCPRLTLASVDHLICILLICIQDLLLRANILPTHSVLPVFTRVLQLCMGLSYYPTLQHHPEDLDFCKAALRQGLLFK